LYWEEAREGRLVKNNCKRRGKRKRASHQGLRQEKCHLEKGGYATGHVKLASRGRGRWRKGEEGRSWQDEFSTTMSSARELGSRGHKKVHFISSQVVTGGGKRGNPKSN